jgi:phosphoribosylformimino-5-aminoimidazole carboxamide ribotide isomerase
VHRPVTLFPAIDLRGGRCVRLEQGSPDRQTVYSSDPLDVAQTFARYGAEWIHVVDLDAAFGEGTNRRLIVDLAGASGIKIQTGGGLRTIDDLEEVLDGPVARAVIGTAAIEKPDLVRESIARWGPDRIAVGIDARDRRPAVRGWREDSSEDLFDLALRLAHSGVATFIYTDISRDGVFAGPNLQVSAELADRTGADVIVSGGVGTIEHLDAVAETAREHTGITGVIVGKAIYEKRITVADALRRLKG